MSWSILVSSVAETDIAVTYSWYEEQQEGLGGRFIAEVEKCLFLYSTPAAIHYRSKTSLHLPQ